MQRLKYRRFSASIRSHKYVEIRKRQVDGFDPFELLYRYGCKPHLFAPMFSLMPYCIAMRTGKSRAGRDQWTSMKLRRGNDDCKNWSQMKSATGKAHNASVYRQNQLLTFQLLDLAHSHAAMARMCPDGLSRAGFDISVSRCALCAFPAICGDKHIADGRDSQRSAE